MSFKINNGFRSQAVKAVVFDLDGTLIDSTIDFAEMNRAAVRALIDNGLPRDALDTKCNVNDNINRAHAYFKEHGKIGWEDAVERDLNRVSLEVEMVNVDRTKAIPGTLDLLKLLHKNEIRTAILTRGSRKYTLRALNASGLEGEFHTIVCRDDHPLTEAKPNPIALHRVFEQLSLTNEQCMFVGDHETDHLCAKGAGTPFAAVLTGFNGMDVWDRTRPDVVMDSIADLRGLLEVDR